MDREGLPPDGVRPFVFLEEALKPLGLCLRGGFTLTETDGLGEGSLLLVGSVGSALWSVAPQQFRAVDDPLDDWTRRVIDPLAARCGARVLYPFAGPPFYPFQHWLRRALGLHPSPTGLLMDPVYGLWHALRAALILPVPWSEPPPAAHPSPCETCEDKPCLSVCPVQAITPAGPQPHRCAAELTGLDRGRCVPQGCLARQACPVGRTDRYPTAQQAFHQRAFLRLIS
ncbi:hypothetical protein [Novispirillum itersonii]|uniref:Ferredoxin n=1 Tax=Novispirillum itersonii TaxID=189 RepID=A0A7X0DM85_NOVIT|nr:hypothetical protein [Novispirillum itersonii]MBB6210798.1 ferredoxin [Novispirillum itersonii]